MKSISIEHKGKLVTIANEVERDTILGEKIAKWTSTGCSFADAWGAVERKFPALFAGMKGPQIKMPYRPKPATIANESAAPTFDPMLKSIFLLGPAATQDVAAAAWRANSSQGQNMNYPAILKGVVNWIAKRRGIDLPSAKAAAKQQFSDLWTIVASIEAVIPSADNITTTP